MLFGEVWSRTDKLGLRDRSLVTITSLISMGITDNSLVYHLQSAKKNGITRTEIAESITHIGFYAGWPKAWAAFNLAKGVWSEDIVGEDAKTAFQREMIFPIGEPNTAYAQYFIGNSYLASVSREQVNISNVTFEPRCRNNWHIPVSYTHLKLRTSSIRKASGPQPKEIICIYCMSPSCIAAHLVAFRIRLVNAH